MIILETDFESADGGFAGEPLTYKQVIRSEKAAVYERSRADRRKDWEVFIIKIVPKGKVNKFPNGTTSIVTDDTEKYATTSQFGRIAWSCTNLAHAMRIYDNLLLGKKPSDEIIKTNEELGRTPEAKEARKVIREATSNSNKTLLIPVGEFTTKTLAEFNHVQYPAAFLFLKSELDKTIVFIREQKTAGQRGKPSKIYSAKTS